MEIEKPASPGPVDDLFDYDFGLDELLQEAPNRPDNDNPRQSSTQDASGLGLGLDEEVKVTKKRQPVAKLDESRLLSQPGIPKLRRTAKEKLKFRGKGHEFSNAARLLNFYQLWLDDLFPRAKFADGLAIIERLGHSKRLQTMRREWIEEEKPKKIATETQSDSPLVGQPPGDQPNDADDDMMNTERSRASIPGADTPDGEQGPPEDRTSSLPQTGTDEGLFMSDNENMAQHPGNQGAPDDDELDALLREQEDLVFSSTFA